MAHLCHQKTLQAQSSQEQSKELQRGHARGASRVPGEWMQFLCAFASRFSKKGLRTGPLRKIIACAGRDVPSPGQLLPPNLRWAQLRGV